MPFRTEYKAIVNINDGDLFQMTPTGYCSWIGEYLILNVSSRDINIEFPSIYRMWRTTEIVASEIPFLADRWHGTTERGCYVPVVRAFFAARGSYAWPLLVSGITKRFSCGHCALKEALCAIQAGSGVVENLKASGAHHLLPSVLFIGDQFFVSTERPDPNDWEIDANDEDISETLDRYSLPQQEVIGDTQPIFATKKTTLDATACGNCGIPGHNRRTCNRVRVWDKIGIEIEGLFENLPTLSNRAATAGLNGCGDGSLRLNFNPALRAYEFQTRPGTPTEAINQLLEFYPDEVNSTCGMHVHVSFLDKMAITQLATEEFFAFFNRKWEAWAASKNLNPRGALLERLAGKNTYCLKNDEDELDESITRGDRYRQINFVAWEEHKTVEFRLLPMFQNSALGVEAVLYLLGMLEEWLTTPAIGPALLFEESALTPRDILSFTQTDEYAFEVELDSPAPISDELHIPLPSIEPPAPGHVRRVCTPEQIQTLREMGLVA